MNDPLLEGLGTPIHVTWECPRGEALTYNGGKTGPMIFLHPSDWMHLRHNGVPLWTQYTLGNKEAERDRRKYTKR